MKKLILLSIILVSGITVFAQRKTVTNMDLEKYRQKRLAAERDYRENYERLGFPSPEELRKRQEQEEQETAEFSAKLRAEQAEKARFETLREQNEALQRQNSYYSAPAYNQSYYTPNYPFGYRSYGTYDYRYPRSFPQYDNGSRSWSFTQVQPNPIRISTAPRIIKPPIRNPRQR